MSLPLSDSKDSSTKDDKGEHRKEEENSKSTKDNIEKLFSSLEQSLKAYKDWLVKAQMKKEAPLLEVTAVSKGEINQELLYVIEELELESDTDKECFLVTASDFFLLQICDRASKTKRHVFFLICPK